MTSKDIQCFLQPDRRVPLQGIIAELSAQETRGIQEPLAKARAIYNYVIATMRYDKTGTGWGNGDAIPSTCGAVRWCPVMMRLCV